MDHLDHKEQMDLADHADHKDILDLSDHLDNKDHLDLADLKDILDLWEDPDHKDHLDQTETKDQKDIKDLEEIPDHMDLLDHKDLHQFSTPNQSQQRERLSSALMDIKSLEVVVLAILETCSLSLFLYTTTVTKDGRLIVKVPTSSEMVTVTIEEEKNAPSSLSACTLHMMKWMMERWITK